MVYSKKIIIPQWMRSPWSHLEQWLVCRKRKGIGKIPLHLQIARSIFSRFTLLVRELIQGIGWRKLNSFTRSKRCSSKFKFSCFELFYLRAYHHISCHRQAELHEIYIYTHRWCSIRRHSQPNEKATTGLLNFSQVSSHKLSKCYTVMFWNPSLTFVLRTWLTLNVRFVSIITT